MTAWTVIGHVYLQQLMALAFGTTYVTHICSILIANIFLLQLMITDAIVSERYKENVGIFLHHLRFSIAIYLLRLRSRCKHYCANTDYKTYNNFKIRFDKNSFDLHLQYKEPLLDFNFFLRVEDRS